MLSLLVTGYVIKSSKTKKPLLIGRRMPTTEKCGHVPNEMRSENIPSVGILFVFLFQFKLLLKNIWPNNIIIYSS